MSAENVHLNEFFVNKKFSQVIAVVRPSLIIIRIKKLFLYLKSNF